MERLRRVLAAHTYWATRGLRVDLVILNEAPTSYHDALNDEVLSLIRASEDRDRMNRPGGVFIRKADQFSPDDLTLLLSWARAVVTGDQGQLEELIGLNPRPYPLPGDRFTSYELNLFAIADRKQTKPAVRSRSATATRACRRTRST
jgi:cellobiose phosphorylase